MNEEKRDGERKKEKEKIREKWRKIYLEWT